MNTRIRWMRTTASAALVCIGIAALAQGHVPGRVLVKFKEGVSMSAAHQTLLNVGGTTQRTLRGLSTKVVVVPVGREALIANQLRASDDIEYAEVDGYAQPAQVVPDDPLYAGGNPGCAQWPLLKIGCPMAWTMTTGSASVIIAIIDTGVDDIHEDLHDKITPGYNVGSNNTNTQDSAGHGTIVAGTAAAHADNTTGVASVAWGVRIMPIRITSSNGAAPFSNFAEALGYAQAHGAKVANISWTPMWASGAVLDAARNFRQAGGLVVVAAGNNGYQYTYNDFQELLVVGASDGNDNYTSYSNYGNFLDLVAPGSTFTTAKGQNYVAASGTSVATPYVSAAAAMLWSFNPGLTSSQVEEYLESSADDRGPAGFDIHYGWGRLNVSQALVAAGGTPGGGGGDITAPVVDILSPNAGATVSGTIDVTAEASDNVGVVEVRLMIDGDVVATDTTAPYVLEWNTEGWSNGAHSLRVRALDAAGNSGDDVINVDTMNKLADTSPPSVSITSPANNATVAGNVTFSANASDNVEVAFVEFFVDGAWHAADSSSPYSCSWDSRTVPNGAHTLMAIAEDTSGNRTSTWITVTVSNNIPDTTPPTVTITSPSQGQTVSGNTSVTVDVWDNNGVARCELYVNGVLRDTSTNSPFTLRFNTNRMGRVFTLTVKAYDAAGNVGISPPVTVYR